MFKTVLFAAALACACGTAHAQITDDFDRPIGANLGPNYTSYGNVSILDGAAVSTFTGLAVYNDQTATSASIDVALRGADSGSYVALSFGYPSADSFFIKVQDNNGDGAFDSYGFYTGNNGFLNGLKDLNPFFNGRVTASYEGSVATLSIDMGWGTQSFSYDYGFGPATGAIGFGLNRLGSADNFSFNGAAPNPTGVPEPAAWGLLIGGFGFAGASLRTRRRAVSFA
ncbi:PEPxxWA-CTERM sorting domain-containing protein [Sphingomonas sp. RS6]